MDSFMDFHKRDFFMHRIISGVLLYDYEGLELEIRCPAPNVKYKAAGVYQEHYAACQEAGVLTEEQVLQYLMDNNMWSEEDEELYQTTIPTDIENTKVKLYLSESIPAKRKMAERILLESRKSYAELGNRRSQLSQNTCRTAALYMQKEYELRHSTYLDGEKYNWGDADIKHLVSFYYNNIIPDSYIREIARTTPWTNYLTANKYTGDIFGIPSTKLTDEQLVLLSWTSLYDNVKESYEPPPSHVVENDDMLDGWLILQRREQEEKQKKEQGKFATENEKIAKSDEVFVAATYDADSPTGYRKISPSDVAAINAMNTPHAEVLKKTRINQIIKERQVNHNDLHDVKQDINIAKANLFREKMKASKK